MPKGTLGSDAAFVISADAIPEKSVQLSEWIHDQGHKDVGLVGAFVFTMRKRNKYAAPPSEYDAAFAAFAAEMPE